MSGRARSGQLLIASLWVFTLFALLAAGLGFRSGLEAKIAFFDRREIEDRVKIESVLAAVVYLFDADPARSVDSPLDGWYNQPAFFQSSALGEGVRVTVADEESKINLNFASEALLRALLERVGQVEELDTDVDDLAASILSWRGETSIQGGPQVGWEQKSLPFETVAELLLIHDVTDADARTLSGFVTAYAPPGQTATKVNINTASPLVLAALIDSLAGDEFAKAELYETVEKFRHPDAALVVAFDEELLQPRNFIETLRLPKTIQMISLVSQLMLFVTTDSQFLNVRLELMEGERPRRRVEAVLGPKTQHALASDVKGAPTTFAPAAATDVPEVVYWHEER